MVYMVNETMGLSGHLVVATGQWTEVSNNIQRLAMMIGVVYG
jgi:hypothetical protein